MIGIDPAASREAFSKVSVSFDSDGLECAAWLYRPDRPRAAPLVVMGPGLAAERTFGYPALAEGLAERGVATLLFDYRQFGDSEGTPRGVISIPGQIADWGAAIDRALALDTVDTDSLALWGHSLGGGHAIRVAAADRRVDAVVAHSPVVDGQALLRANDYPWLGKALLAGVRDRLLGALGRPHRIPVVSPEWDRTERVDRQHDGDRGTDRQHCDRGVTQPTPEPAPRDQPLALMPHREAAEAFSEVVPLRSDWKNTVRARTVLDLWSYTPGGAAANMDTPTLLVTGADDRLVPASSVARTARTLSQGSFLALPTDHFSLLREPWRQRLLGHAETFLADALDG